MKKKVIVIITLLAALAFFSIMFSIVNLNNNKIYSKITIQNLSVSGKEQETVNEELNKKYSQKKLDGIKLIHGDYETTISFDQLGVSTNIADACAKAYAIGRNGNIISNNYSILLRFFVPVNIELDISFDEKSIDTIINDVESKLPDVMIDNNYYIDGNKLIITKGKSGVKINKDTLKSLIIEEIKDFSDENNIIEIPVENVNPEEINIEEIADEITSEPQDAYLSEEPLEVHADKDGIKLGISIDEIK